MKKKERWTNRKGLIFIILLFSAMNVFSENAVIITGQVIKALIIASVDIKQNKVDLNYYRVNIIEKNEIVSIEFTIQPELVKSMRFNHTDSLEWRYIVDKKTNKIVKKESLDLPEGWSEE